MTKIKAIIFDMDGVLIDAKDWHYEALNKALNIFGMEIPLYDHLNTYDGLPTSKKLEMLSQEKGLPRDLHKLINAIKQKFTIELIYSKCRPSFQHEYTLFKLKRDGYQLIVCSNSIRITVETMLSQAKLINYLDFYLSNEDIIKPKPDPEIYLTAIKKLKVKSSECLILEDNENGIKAAKACGAHILEIQYSSDVNYDLIKNKIKVLDHIK
jgi:HAD superfamily hydrolase (TIGR01509 family)